MGGDRTAVAEGGGWTATDGSTPDVERHVLGAAQWRAVARPAGAFRAMADGLSPLQLLASAWGVRPDPRGAASAAGCGGPDRLGSLVRGRDDGARFTLGRRGREKGGSEEPVDHALGRSRGGFGSKLHLVADGHGLPLAVHVTAGQINECTQFEEVMNRVRIGRCTRPEAVAGDKGYSFTAIRDWLRGHSIKAVIP